ncbi:hypothetical protein VP01_76g3 [Puccinia sorghi]|uniref:Uncharacterized protein n=1 Tax=Puccinia sorghi TaxID=27349 RepID=A0A0L6UDN5_9BASI|nr:hypothetical protein VP01_76g3 [Puccinia sorghi]
MFWKFSCSLNSSPGLNWKAGYYSQPVSNQEHWHSQQQSKIEDTMELAVQKVSALVPKAKNLEITTLRNQANLEKLKQKLELVANNLSSNMSNFNALRQEVKIVQSMFSGNKAMITDLQSLAEELMVNEEILKLGNQKTWVEDIKLTLIKDQKEFEELQAQVAHLPRNIYQVGSFPHLTRFKDSLELDVFKQKMELIQRAMSSKLDNEVRLIGGIKYDQIYNHDVQQKHHHIPPPNNAMMIVFFDANQNPSDSKKSKSWAQNSFSSPLPRSNCTTNFPHESTLCNLYSHPVNHYSSPPMHTSSPSFRKGKYLNPGTSQDKSDCLRFVTEEDLDKLPKLNPEFSSFPLPSNAPYLITLDELDSFVSRKHTSTVFHSWDWLLSIVDGLVIGMQGQKMFLLDTLLQAFNLYTLNAILPSSSGPDSTRTSYLLSQLDKVITEQQDVFGEGGLQFVTLLLDKVNSQLSYAEASAAAAHPQIFIMLGINSGLIDGTPLHNPVASVYGPNL